MTNRREITQTLVEATIDAYRQGSFPMSEHGRLGFYSCDPRSVFLFESFHVPKRLKRIARQKTFEMKTDTAFERVVQNCRKGREEWISDPLVGIYLELFERGHAHSVEAWSEGELVGGLFGTHFGSAFIAESMYHSQTHASNICILWLMEHLKKWGFHFCDIQYANEHTLRFNPTDLSHTQFLRIYRRALQEEARFGE